MDFSFVLTHLQNQFSGQSVLYVDDIAKVLGKSEKAVSNLITRDALPFKVKVVGGLRCTDIFQVAQWLVSDQDMAQECLVADVRPPSPEVKSRSVKPPRVTKGQKTPLSNAAPVLTGKVAAMLLAKRHDQATAMGRFVHGLRNIDDLVFMNAVMEKHFYAADLLSSSYVVTLKKLSPKGAKIFADECRKYFGAEDHGADFLMVKLNNWRNRKVLPKNKMVEHFIFENSGKTLFHAIGTGSLLSVVSNAIEFDLPGL